MRYAFVQEGKIVDGPRGLPTAWRNISGFHHMPQQDLIALGWLPWRLVEVPHPGEDYVFNGSTIEITAEEIVETQIYRPKTQGEKDGEEQQRISNVRQSRADAYREESDPLFFKAHRGEATMDEWLAKVEEIKARFPK